MSKSPSLRTVSLCALVVFCIFSQPASPLASDLKPSPSLQDLEKTIATLQDSLNRLADHSPYIVINRVHNNLQIRTRSQILSEAICATGSGKILRGPRQKTWAFNTPRGSFKILRKVKNPIWAKPEWAFAERGKAAPVLPWAFERLDLTTLGDYALELGDGYEIHGTLYPHLLGRHITHGCIRLNDEDLKAAYTLSGEGTRVFIY